MRTCLRSCVVLLVCWMLQSSANALPRFAALTGQKCESCHVNPSGDDMRQLLGVKYGRDDLPVPEWSSDFEIDDFSNMLTNFLGVGADFRTLYYYQQVPPASSAASATSQNSFFQMQGDLYLNFRVAKKVSLFLKKGLTNGYEIFGLLSFLPANGYLKLGKFVPDYGTKVDDHTFFIRRLTGLSPELGRPELTGAEVAVSPGPVTILGGIYNAQDGIPSAGNKKAFLGRAEGMFKLSDVVNLGIGGNVMTGQLNPVSAIPPVPIATFGGTTTTLYGGFGSLGLGGKFSLLGEVDWIKPKDSALQPPTAFVSYVEGDYVLTQGVVLKLAYDFYDPDIDLKTGSTSRYTIGVEFFPISGVELRPEYRIVKDMPVELKNDEFDVTLHIYL